MKILIAGASGFIGKELTTALQSDHQVTVLGRSLEHLDRRFPQTFEKIVWDNLNQHDATQFSIIINLAGSNIGEKKWTPAIKKELIESRTLTNKKLIDWLIAHKARPHFYCANAIGIYGAYDANVNLFDEEYPINKENSLDFLRHIGMLWEESLTPAIEHGMKVTTFRFGVVLKKGEGMLKKLELPFNLGLGSTLGNGNQIISWIHHIDLINAILFLIKHSEVTGPVNITAPHAVSQKEFARELATALKRPLLLKMPAFFVKALFGEMGEYLLLKGQNVYPKRLIDLGFTFSYPYLVEALRREYA